MAIKNNIAPAKSVFEYSLTLGLPHTNLNGLAEAALLMYAGHFQWTSIAQALGRPMSELKTPDGLPIYATYYYVDEQFPPSRPINYFKPDMTLRFINRLRHFKGIAIDGDIVFDLPGKLPEATEEAVRDLSALRGKSPTLRMCNVFISPFGGTDALKITAPQEVSFDALEVLPPEEHAYTLSRSASVQCTFGLLPHGPSIDRSGPAIFHYPVNPDRDTNGAGLVYFANYICFLDMAERRALAENSMRWFSEQAILHRALRRRQIAYYGNINLDDTLEITTSLYFNEGDQTLGIRSLITRQSDKKLIAFSEAVKVIGRHD
jgi:probable biosynthetic protein (TIGR04098 family)